MGEWLTGVRLLAVTVVATLLIGLFVLVLLGNDSGGDSAAQTSLTELPAEATAQSGSLTSRTQ